MPTDVWAEAGAILFEAMVAIALLWLAFNAAGHLARWAWFKARDLWSSTPPKPDLGPYQGPRIIGSGDFVRAGQAQRDKP